VNNRRLAQLAVRPHPILREGKATPGDVQMNGAKMRGKSYTRERWAAFAASSRIDKVSALRQVGVLVDVAAEFVD
jgi:hypothetical protein